MKFSISAAIRAMGIFIIVVVVPIVLYVFKVASEVTDTPRKIVVGAANQSARDISATRAAISSSPSGDSSVVTASRLNRPLPPNATDPQCIPVQGTDEWCECDQDISKLPIVPPNGMVLIDASCRYVVGSKDLIGAFTFKGEATVSGVVTREDNNIFGDSIWFNAKNPNGYSQFASEIYSLKFGNSSTAIEKFRLPALSEKSNCWYANAVIKVRRLDVLSGGTDQDGNAAMDYDVLEIGEYKQCDSNK